MLKYALKSQGGSFLSLDDATATFTSIDNVPLFGSQSALLRAFQDHLFTRGIHYITPLSIVRVDEVAHAGETKEVRRKFSEPKADGTVSTRYEIDKHCSFLGGPVRVDTVEEVIDQLTSEGARCPKCGTFTVEAIDTVQLPPYTTRVASELA